MVQKSIVLAIALSLVSFVYTNLNTITTPVRNYGYTIIFVPLTNVIFKTYLSNAWHSSSLKAQIFINYVSAAVISYANIALFYTSQLSESVQITLVAALYFQVAFVFIDPRCHEVRS